MTNENQRDSTEFNEAGKRMRALTVLCDLDGIVVDLLGPWLAAYNAEYGDSLTQAQVTDWDIHKCVKPECGSSIYKWIDSGEVYRDLKPLPGAIEGIKALEAMGHEVVIVSAGSKNLATAGHKLEWCEKHLGFSRKKVMIAHRKDLVRGDILIDDSPEKISEYAKAWPDTPIFSIRYPYNWQMAELPQVEMFDGWDDTASAWKQMVKCIRAYGYMRSNVGEQ